MSFLSVPAMIEAQSLRHPDAIALVCGDARLSFRELQKCSLHWAAQLALHGLRAGDVAAVCATSSIDYVALFLAAVSTGIVVLKVLDRLKPGCVEWKKIDKNPNNTFKKGINCTEIINVAKKLGLKIPGIGGTDFVDGKKKNIIAVVW